MTGGELPSVSIVIPTYRREQVLIESLDALLGLECPAKEIWLIDQTERHEIQTERALERWHAKQAIRWIRQSKPSITGSMNYGLKSANCPLVLFLDDDIKPHPGLVRNHARAHDADDGLWATVGQVVQPWQQPDDLQAPRKLRGLRKDFDFPFQSTCDAEVENVMAGNLCVNRERALSIGGFDENFVGPAFRFETDFARRLIAAGGKVRFIGAAGIDHLHAQEGGTRSSGSHLTSASPLHGFGDYYYAFRHGDDSGAWRYSIARMFREVRTRFHLARPWWIPVKLLGEIRALHAGRRQARLGPRLLQVGERS